MKILLVEDDAMLHQLYFDILKSAGYEVVEAMDGQQAFSHMKEGGYDLVLLDQLLPGMTGMEILEKLKTEPSTLPNKKVVFMTNVDDPKQFEVMKTVSDGYIFKSSLTPDQFLQKVKEYIG